MVCATLPRSSSVPPWRATAISISFAKLITFSTRGRSNCLAVNILLPDNPDGEGAMARPSLSVMVFTPDKGGRTEKERKGMERKEEQRREEERYIFISVGGNGREGN